MASLSDLITALSRVTGIPEATVFAYGRFARQEGLITQKGRGHSAARMNVRDAANLLMALGGTGVTKEAGAAIQRLRPMSGRLHSLAGPLTPIFLDWFKPLGITAVPDERFGTMHKLDVRFGAFLEHLIRAVLDGTLIELVRQVPVADISIDLYRQWYRDQSPHLHSTMGVLIEQGIVAAKSPEKITLGDDVTVEVVFDRSSGSADVQFSRFESTETLFVATFSPPQKRRKSEEVEVDLSVVASLTQHSLGAMALVLSGMVASARISRQTMDGLFLRQLRRQWKPISLPAD